MTSTDSSSEESETEEIVLFGSKRKNSSKQVKASRPKKSKAENRRKLIKNENEEAQALSPGFQQLGVSDWICKSLNALGIKEPTEIQKGCIVETLEGSNILGSAKTGSGKTICFCVPILQKLAHDPYGIHSVVLTPTRELAFQIWDQFNALGAPIRVKCEVIVGGVSMLQQSVALSARPHVVVATPGRLAAHVNSADPPYLKKTKFVVFDEADRLLESSFRKALSIINSKLPPDNQRQTLLYSATMTSTLEQLRASLSKTQKLFEFHASPIDTTVDTLDERYLLIPDQVKHAYLGYILRFWGPPDVEKSSLDIKSKSLRKKKRRRPRDVVKVEAEDPEENGVDSSANVEESNLLVDNKRAELMIIFVSTCKNCQLIGEMLLELGVNCVALHSYLTQNRRLAALGKFRSGVAKILIATDVASRGLDIPEVDLVLNYDVPRNPEDYIHRAGRTARAGRFGRAITFVTQYDVNLVLAIEKVTEKKMKLLEDVQEEEVLVLLTRMSNAKQAAKIRIDDTGQTIVKRKKGRAV